MAKKIVKKISRNIRDFGFVVFFKKLLSSGLKPIFEIRTYHIYSIDLRKSELRDSASRDDITFRFIAWDEASVIRQIEDMEEWLAGAVSDKLKRGQRCLVAMSGNDVAGFNLISHDKLHLPVVRLQKRLRPRECSSEQITVHPRFRGLGLGTALRNAFFLAMKNEGYVRIYGGTEATNTANKALTCKVGFRIFAEARFMSILGYQKLRVSRLRQP